jgi:hypothetical protein
MPLDDRNPGRAPPRAEGPRAIVPAAVLAAGFLLAACLVIGLGDLRGRAASDQVRYHERAVREFASQWPHLDYSDYLSATTPGYHTLLALVCRFVSCDGGVLRGAGAILGAVLVGILAHACDRGGRPRGWVLALPFACSMYVFGSAAYLLPDDAGWLGVLVVLMLALGRWRGGWTLAAGGCVLALLVFTRQIHAWAMAPMWAAAWLGEPRDGAPLLAPTRARAIRAAMALAASLPAIGVIAWFARLWGGLTPPTFAEFYARGVNPAAPAFVLSILAIGSVFFGAHLAPALRDAWAKHRGLLALAALAGLIAGAAPETTYDKEAGRWSGVWNVVDRLPTLADRSPLIVLLSIAGAVALAGWSVALSRRDRWVLLAAIAGFTSAQAASFQLWQRYSEPFVLMLIALMAARIPGAPEARGRGAVARWGGPALLACLLGVMSLADTLLGTVIAPDALPLRQRGP